MPVRLRNTVLFLLLGAAAFGSWLLRPAAPLRDAALDTSAPSLGYYINDAVFSGLDDDGRIIYRLVAARIEGFEDSTVLNLDDVEIRYAPELELPWRITATSARSGADQETLELAGVIIESTTENPDERTRIEAAALSLEPKRQLVSTPGPVRFAIGASRIDAVGLSADLRAERFSLESGVYGQVAP